MNDSHQFNVRDLFVAITAVASTLALFSVAISQQSSFLLFLAALMLGVCVGGTLGFFVSGRKGVRWGALVGIAVMFIVYSSSVASFG